MDKLILINDAAEIIETATHDFAKGTAIIFPAHVALILAKGQFLKDRIGDLADYVIKVTIVAESLSVGGYTSIDDLRDTISGILENISEKMREIASFERDKAEAERLWSEL